MKDGEGGGEVIRLDRPGRLRLHQGLLPEVGGQVGEVGDTGEGRLRDLREVPHIQILGQGRDLVLDPDHPHQTEFRGENEGQLHHPGEELNQGQEGQG